MLKTITAAALMTTSLAITGAFAQAPSPNSTTAPPNTNMTAPATPAPGATTAPLNNPALNTNAAMMNKSGWRASKMMGLDVYNQQNEKLGDINEIIFDRQGKVTGVVIGVGGFLGLGEHDVMVSFDQLRFVDEARTAANTAAPANNNAARSNTTVGAANPRADAGNAGNANSAATTSPAARNDAAAGNANANGNWYPDHAILNASKDQLKAMPEFTYSTYNNPADVNRSTTTTAPATNR